MTVFLRRISIMVMIMAPAILTSTTGIVPPMVQTPPMEIADRDARPHQTR